MIRSYQCKLLHFIRTDVWAVGEAEVQEEPFPMEVRRFLSVAILLRMKRDGLMGLNVSMSICLKVIFFLFCCNSKIHVHDWIALLFVGNTAQNVIALSPFK